MKLVTVTEYSGRSLDEAIGGLDTRMFSLLNRLSGRHEIEVVCSRQPGDPAEERVNGMSFVRLGPQRDYTQRAKLRDRMEFIRATRRYLAHSDADAVNGDGLVGANALATVPPEEGSFLRIATIHEIWKHRWARHLGPPQGAIGTIAERRIMRKPWSKLIAASQATKNNMQAEYHVNPDRIAVVTNGIDLKEIRRFRSRPKYPQKTLITVARLVPQKRVDRSIMALREVKRRFEDARLLIIGTGHEERRLRGLSDRLGLSDSVQFLGRLDRRSELLETVSRSHVLLHFSMAEGFGIAVFEALALGVPYVATDLPAIREATKGGVGGFLVSERDPRGVMPAVMDALRGAAVANAEEDRETICRQADWDGIARQYERILLDLPPK